MLDKKYYVYEWYVKLTNEVFYVGKGSGNRYKTSKRENEFFMKMLNSHDCDVRIVKNGLTEEEAFELEKSLIKLYRTTNFRLSNVADGGQNPPRRCGKRTAEERKKISDGIKKFYMEHPERRKQVSEIIKKYCNSEEGKKRKSEVSKSNWADEEIRNKIISKMKSTMNTEEFHIAHSNRMSKAYSNEEVRQKIRGENNGHSKKICQYSLKGDFLATFNSLIEAEKQTGVPFKQISKVLRGTNKTAKGFVFKYYENQGNIVPSLCESKERCNDYPERE